MTAGDADVRDRPLTFERGSVRDVIVTLTDQRTAVTGTLSSSSDAPATDYFVVIFPGDRLWHPHARRLSASELTYDSGVSKIWVRRCASFEEERAADREFWAQLTPGERIAAVEELRAQWATMSGHDDEGLRSTTSASAGSDCRLPTSRNRARSSSLASLRIGSIS